MWKVIPGVDINSSISYTYGQNITQDEPLRRIPPLNGKVAATYSLKKFIVSGELIFAGMQDRLAEGDKSDNRIPAGGTPGWEVVNLFAGSQLVIVKMKAGFENIQRRLPHAWFGHQRGWPQCLDFCSFYFLNGSPFSF